MSDKFLKLAKSTRAGYDYGFREAERLIGDVPVTSLSPPALTEFLDLFAATPTMQRIVLQGFKSLERWGMGRGRFLQIFTIGVEAPGGDGAHEPWTDEQVRFAEANARPDVAMAITLAANTGQRASDLVTMRWQDIESYQGRPGINVVQQKTKRVLWVPFTQELIRQMETWDRGLGYLITKVNREPYTREQLTQAWERERRKNLTLAPLRAAGLVLHGLRATAVVRLRRAGISKPLIGDFVGMSSQMVDRYCRKSEQKDNAIAALEMMENKAKIIPLRSSDIHRLSD